MPFLVGTDEAGYAPNLGPLVISASVWHVSETMDLDMYGRLKAVVSRTPPKDPRRRLAIADSKVLYSPAVGLRDLERGVLAALSLVGQCPVDWLEVWQLLDVVSAPRLETLPWHVGYNLRLPLAADLEDVVEIVRVLRRGFERSGVRLVGMLSRAVFPDELNRTTTQLGNKGEALSQVTLALVGEALKLCAGEPVLVVCDKHGGRNRYAALLQNQFPDHWVEVRQEGLNESAYRWQQDGREVEVRFRVRGERFLPTALASMTSKYLRELAMRAFNDFWCTRVEDLAPTAGYPGDARRFHQAIAPLQRSLGIEDCVVWRER